MLESTIFHKGQHAGLQKLSALAEASRSSLGPWKSFKFIHDDTTGESALACSSYRILENLELSCPVAQLVQETLQAHQKVYHTGSGCLLFLTGAWSRAALHCLHIGIPASHIMSAMNEGLALCRDVCRRSTVSMEAVSACCTAASEGSGLRLPQKLATEAPQVGRKTLNFSGQRKVKLSRHFCEINCISASKLTQTPEPKQPPPKLPQPGAPQPGPPQPGPPQPGPPQPGPPQPGAPQPGPPQPGPPQPGPPQPGPPQPGPPQPGPPQPGPPQLAAVAQGLSHGCDESMKLVMEAIQMQSEAAQEDVDRPMFDVTDVVTCLVPGLPEHQACVVQGCVVLLSAEQALLAQQTEEKSLQVALITGDLSDDFRHLGFHRLTGSRRVSDRLPGSSGEDGWMERVGSLLLSLDVNLVLISGFACESMVEFCWRHQILVVEKVKVSTLRTFADVTGAVAVAYATQLSRQCLGSGATVRIWRELSGRHGKPAAAVNICPGGSGGLVTVILTSYLPAKLLALEDRFWACAHRVHYALKDRVLLPGAGRTEMLCVHQLLKQDDGTAGARVRAVVLPLMAEGLMDYLSSVMVNTGRVSRVQARTLVSQQLQNRDKQRSSTPKFCQLLLEADREEVMKPEEPPAVQIYDNWSVKQEAWRKALDVVFLVLQSDAEIITGGGQHTDPPEEHLSRL